MKPLLREVADVSEGLALEGQLFEATGSHVLLWTSRVHGLVCPKSYQRLNGFAVAVQSSACSGWPVHLRPSGGGAVPQGPGIINLALAFDAPDGFTMEDGYRALIRAIKNGLKATGDSLAPGSVANSFCDGKWNLSHNHKKVVGTAQRWRPVRGGKPRVLAHALVLVDDRFQIGTERVAKLHGRLGLPPVYRSAHASLRSSLGITILPIDAWHRAANEALGAI